MSPHPALARQLQRCKISAQSPPSDIESWARFLELVQKTYEATEEERAELEHSLAMSSQETHDLLHRLEESHTRQMEEERDFQKAVIGTLGAGLAVLDARGAVVSINPEGVRLLGWDEESQLVGKRLTEWILPSDAGGAVPLIDALVRSGSAWTDRGARFIDRELGMLPVSYVVKPIQSGGENAGAVLVFTDMTEIRRTEAELAAARDEALRAAQLKSEFLANMSHEIRTPMNGVLGMTEFLAETHLDGEQNDLVRTLRSCAEALLAVINDILDLSKIEAGKMKIEAVDFDLRSQTEELVHLLAPSAQEKGLEILCNVSPDLPGSILGDSVRFRQILTNLTGNAVKFTERGEVVVGIDVLEEGTQTVRIRLSVRDTGIGIPEDRQATIFDSFTQVDGSTTRRFGGTGLGLTITRQLVELMGGEIGVDSKYGEGSTFWAELEVPKGEGAPGRRASAVIAMRDLPVLIVDDNATNRQILCKQMRTWGAKPTEACDGVEALKMLLGPDKDTFGLVILDMQMPTMSGLDLAAVIKCDPELEHLPLVILSSIGDVTTREASESYGIDAWLTKPVRQSDLFNSLVEILHAADDFAPEPEPSLVSDDFDLDVRHNASLRLNVLLVEDNMVNQKVARRMLGSLGHDVETAENGEVGVRKWLTGGYDLVFMDVQMPVMDGFEATAKIREIEAEKGWNTPVIAMTAHALEGDRERCLAAGMDDYVSKPLKKETLAELLESWQDRIHSGGSA